MKLPKYFYNKFFLSIVLKIYIPIFILLLVITSVSYFTGIPIEVFTRDPAVVATSEQIIPLLDENHNPFLGILSQIGILFWCVSSSICLFCALIITQKHYIWQNLANFLQFFGLITLILLLDDLFLLHESIFPQLLKIPEEFVYFCYGISVLIGLIKFKKIIIQTEWTILLLSLIFFSFSLILDEIILLNYSVGLKILLEDGFKLLGIASWFCYFGLVCLKVAQSAIKSKNVFE